MNERISSKSVAIGLGLWMLVGQVVMVYVQQNDAAFHPTGSLFFLKHLFPTIDRTESRYIFNAVTASRYLTAMAVFIPILFWFLFKAPVRYFRDEKLAMENKYKWLYVMLLCFIATYAAHFRWDDGFFVRISSWSSVGFALAGATLYALIAYLLRSAVAIGFGK